MKHVITAWVLAMGHLMAFSQLSTSFYVDFGPNDGSNGNETPSPDVNGVYWNNLSSGSTSALTLIQDSENNPTGTYFLKVKEGKRVKVLPFHRE